jgi:N4-gp56 family major capsid protein
MATTGAYGSGNVNIGVTAGNVFRPNIWAKEVLMFVKSNLVLLPLIKHYDSDAQGAGQTIEIPNVSTITANLKAQNTLVTLNYNTETKTTITLNKHYESSFLVEDILKAQSAYDLRSDYTMAAAYAIAEKVDNSIATLMTSSFTGYGVFGTAINDTLILAVNRYLDDAKAPQTDRSLVVTPQGKAEMLAIDKYIRYDAIGIGGTQNSIVNGQIGEIYGVKVYMSQNLVVTAGTPTQNNHLFFHKEAFAVAMQQEPRTQATYKQEYLGWLVTVDVLFGINALRTTFGYVVKS